MKIRTRFFITFFCFALFFSFSTYLAQDSLFKHTQNKEDAKIENQINVIQQNLFELKDETYLQEYLSTKKISLQTLTYSDNSNTIIYKAFTDKDNEVARDVVSEYTRKQDIKRSCNVIDKMPNKIKKENPRSSDGDFLIQTFCQDKTVYIVTSHYFQYQAAIKLLQQSYLLILAVTIFVSAVLSYILARYISTPITRISYVTKKLSNLDFSSRVEVVGKDEIGELATDINILSDKLQHSIQKLKDSIIIEKEASERQIQLFASMSHELKTPITILKGTLEGIKDQVGPYKEPLNFVDDMIEEANNMENIVMNLLSYAKFSVNDVNLSFKPYHLNDLLEEAIDRLYYLIKDNDIVIEKTISDDIVEVDLPSMQMVLKNVLENAIYYSEKGAKVEIFTSSFTNHVLIQIYNHGTNISGENTLHIFEPFYRDDASRLKYKNGTGLGLTIVKQILDQHQSNFSMYNINNDDEYAVCFEFTLKKVKKDK